MNKKKQRRFSSVLQFLVGLLFFLSSASYAQNFTLPIEGVPYEDWTVVNYVDLDNTSGFIDFTNGNYTYNGHDAIDFTLPHFAAMDAGVSVLAASDGVVVDIHDGEFDRWSRVNPNPGFQANYVVIDHLNGVTTSYLHLKKNSIIVAVGDNVSRGQKIGEVGSSGYSTDPHLHFTVFQNNTPIETYLNSSFWWEAPLPYAGTVDGILDLGITDHFPTEEELVDKPISVTEYDLQNGAGQLVVSWSTLHWNGNDGRTLSYSLKNPSGSVVNQFNYTLNQIRFGWWIVGFNLPSNATVGQWSIVATTSSGQQWLQSTFRVVDSSLTCNGKNITVYLGGGDTPTAGSDVILGTSEADVITALGGDDTICALEGNDVINGGTGNDWVDAGLGQDKVFGLNGQDILTGGFGNDEIIGGNGNDTINGNSGNDVLNGGSGNDTIDGGAGDDAIYGQAGIDMIIAGAGDDFILGSDGDDQIFGGDGDDVINGGPGDDVVRGQADDDIIYGLTGNDTVDGGAGDDSVFGQIGADTVIGGSGSDQLFGNEGHDTITVVSGSNTINGGPGNDAITGGFGDDSIFGDGNLQQAGNDVINGGGGEDIILGFAGNDTITSTDGTVDTVNGGPGVDTCNTDAIDTVFLCP